MTDFKHHDSDSADADLSGAQREALASAFHETYRRNMASKKPPDDPAMQPWESLDPALRFSNYALAGDVPRKLKAIGCEIASGKEDEGLRLAPEEIDTLAAAEHDRWNHERFSQGWTLGERDVAKKTSPYLVPFDDLPKDVQDWDRDVVKAIPDVVRAAGLGIRRSRQEKVFLIRDFSDSDLEVYAEAAAVLIDSNLEWSVPGLTNDVPSQEIFDNVRSEIDGAHHVLAAVDHPNANVAFEMGYALGRGASLSLFQVARGGLPPWLDQSPFESWGVQPVASGQDLVDLAVRSTDVPWQDRSSPAFPGHKVALLAPLSGVSAEVARFINEALLELEFEVTLIQEPHWNWREAPTNLGGVGHCILLFERPPGETHEGETDALRRRDGAANSIHAAIAGYLLATTGRRPLLMKHKVTKRRLADLGGQILEYGSIRHAVALVKKEISERLRD